MKNLLLTLTLSLAAIFSFGQTVDFGVKAGLNLIEQDHAGTGYYQNSFIPAFNAGGIVDIGFKNFSIQPGLFFTIKGEGDQNKFNDINPGDGGSYLPSKSYLDYIEIPINFLYKTTAGPGVGIHFGGGPYLAYGVLETDVINGQTSSVHTFGFKNPDAGLGVIFGLTLKNRVLIDAGYEFGLINIDEEGFITHNTAITLSGGYMFK